MRVAVFLSSVALLALLTIDAMAQTSLPGTTWIMASAGKRPPSISFDADGKVGGFGGCNRFFGSYKRDGDSLTFSPLGSTRMACPNGTMKMEQAFFDMLAKVRMAKVVSSTLVLMDEGGYELARLSRRSGD